jgi:transposase
MKSDAADQALNPRETRRRRFWSEDEKRRMVAESLAPGASVSKVAQRSGVNANLLFTWRRQGAAGVLQTTAKAIELLPVKVADEPTTPSGRTPAAPAGRMEIALVGGERIVVGADVDAAALARVVKALWRR